MPACPAYAVRIRGCL